MNPIATKTPKGILKQYWGYDNFRPLQEEVIDTILKGRDSLVIMPTGGGKSICFQVPALLQEGLTLVISPLIALMQDQVAQLKKRYIPAAALYAGMHAAEIQHTLARCQAGRIKLLYISPERLKTTLLQETLPKLKISLLAIDEAHCISQWGYDFRPAYLEIKACRKWLANIPTIALTASATLPVQRDIQEKLGLKKAVVWRGSFVRANLAYVVRKTLDPDRMILDILTKTEGSAIIYVTKRADAERVSQMLKKKRMAAAYYHAGLDRTLRKRQQEAWTRSVFRVMVATNAFGMGIDKPDVRVVIHLSPPSSLEAYYQEAGRAGRDGKKSYVVLLYQEAQIERLFKRVDRACPSLERIKAIYQSLANYHQVAVGSHAGVTYPLDLEHFATVYGINMTTLRAGIQKLVQTGLITFNDHLHLPAKVHIKLIASQLYTFQAANPAVDELIKALTQCYGALLFHRFQPISLKVIAKKLQQTPRQLAKQFKELEKLEVLDYQPAGGQAHFTFLTPRYAIDRLPISQKKMEARKKTLIEKVKAVAHYVQHQHRCRQQLILEYFGETSYRRCQCCDRCLADRKKRHLQTDGHVATLRNVLVGGPATPYEVMQQTDPAHKKDIQATIRNLLERGEIRYNEVSQLEWVQH
ncbi:MAG: RecQ family ATP-dependent DNA helicase [Cytophagales bacterium]